MQMSSRPYSAIIFDLDDTLLNTYEQITKIILPQACEAMIERGLDATLEDCLKYRQHYVMTRPRFDFFEGLAQHFTKKGSPEKFSKMGQKAYNFLIQKADFKLPESRYKLLQDLAAYHDLFLVTAGTRNRQETKVQKLHFEKFFKDIFYVNFKLGMSKRQCFATILEALKVPAEYCLAVGNRVDMEIADAKSLGIKTCLVLTGEYKYMQPLREDEIPDITINDLEELRSICLR